MIVKCEYETCDWHTLTSYETANAELCYHMNMEHYCHLDEDAYTRLCQAESRPLLYVAGPMGSHGNLLENVRIGCLAGKQAYEMGWVPVVPHASVIQAMITGDFVVEPYLVMDYAYILKCKAVWFLDDWDRSHGATEEMKLVKALKIPHFFGNAKTPAEVFSTEAKTSLRPTGPGETGLL